MSSGIGRRGPGLVRPAIGKHLLSHCIMGWYLQLQPGRLVGKGASPWSEIAVIALLILGLAHGVSLATPRSRAPFEGLIYLLAVASCRTGWPLLAVW